MSQLKITHTYNDISNDFKLALYVMIGKFAWWSSTQPNTSIKVSNGNSKLVYYKENDSSVYYTELGKNHSIPMSQLANQLERGTTITLKDGSGKQVMKIEKQEKTDKN